MAKEDKKITFEEYMVNATVTRGDGKASIILGDDVMVTHDDQEMSDTEMKEECWEVFNMMLCSVEGMEEIIDADQKEYMEELIDNYDQHSFISVELKYDEAEARKEYDKVVAEGEDTPYDEWLDDKKFQALEFEINSKA
jgi:hypothetical protein